MWLLANPPCHILYVDILDENESNPTARPVVKAEQEGTRVRVAS